METDSKPKRPGPNPSEPPPPGMSSAASDSPALKVVTQIVAEVESRSRKVSAPRPAATQPMSCLNLLRVVLTLWIFFYHASKSVAFPYNMTYLRSFIDQGYFGVECFFMLSGFVLTVVNLPRFQASGFVWQTIKFWTSRLFRLYPVHFLVNYFLYYMNWDCTDYQFHREATLSLGWSPVGIGGCNGPSWFLHYEVYLCAFLPLVLGLLACNRAFFLPLAVFAFRVCLDIRFWGEELLNLNTFAMTLRSLSSFWLGVVLATLYSYSPQPSLLFDLGFLGCAYRFFLIFHEYDPASPASVLPKYLLAAGLIYCGGRARLLAFLSDSPLIRVLSELCFSVYMVQLPVINNLRELICEEQHTRYEFSPLSLRSLGFSTLIALVLYFGIEERTKALHTSIFRVLERQFGLS